MNRKLLINGVSLAVILVAAPLALTPADGLANLAAGGTCCPATTGTCVIFNPYGGEPYTQSPAYENAGRCP